MIEVTPACLAACQLSANSLRSGSGTTTIREQGDEITDNTATASPTRFLVVARTNPKSEFGLLRCIFAPCPRANRRLEFTPAVFHESDNARLVGCSDNDDLSSSLMHRSRYAYAGDDALMLYRSCAINRLLLGCLSGLQSRCCVDWRVIGEVEVEGKIKAN
jgi:hypothetical protein